MTLSKTPLLYTILNSQYALGVLRVAQLGPDFEVFATHFLRDQPWALLAQVRIEIETRAQLLACQAGTTRASEER